MNCSKDEGFQQRGGVWNKQTGVEQWNALLTGLKGHERDVKWIRTMSFLDTGLLGIVGCGGLSFGFFRL